MRNLKKILALVLALVMSLSLMATAGAESFPDVDDDNPYATAIEVLDELKVFQGFDDGTFKPTDTLNRAQAAVLVYRIATGDVENKYLDNYTFMQQSKFTDLDGYNWAKGYINYCQNAGIVVGTTATTFDPGAKVTGYQLLVMLLRTLGYGKAGEFADPKGWELQTAAIAEREGITKNVTTGDFGAPAPRQMVAEILFRGLLTETVTYSQLTSGGYTKGETLGKRELGLEEIEGVVVANEYADLYGTAVLAEGKTRVQVADEEKARTLNYGTLITDIGESRLIYTQNTSKVLYMADTGDNVVKQYGEGVDISSPVKFQAVAEMAKTTGTEFFQNFSTTGYYTSDYRIEYVINFVSPWDGKTSAAAYNEAAEFDTTITAKTTTLWSSNNTLRRVIPAGEKITVTDYNNMWLIFTNSNGQTGTGENTTNAGVYDGKVFVGTQTATDISDSKSFVAFEADYLKPIAYDNGWTRSYNGQWVKFIDNNNDGDCEYAFLTNYWLDEVISTYKNKADETVMQYNRFRDDDNEYEGKATTRYMQDAEAVDRDVAVGDIVLVALIDNQYLVSKPDVVTTSATSYNYKTDSITAADGETYGQSGIIRNYTTMQDQLSLMAPKTEYEMFLDKFGFVRAYRQPGGTKYALVTELYYSNNNNGSLVQNWPMTVELTMPNEDGNAETKEYNLSNVSGNPFRALTPWTLIRNLSQVSELQNWLQPAISHLGIPSTAVSAAMAANKEYEIRITPELGDKATYWPLNNQVTQAVNAIGTSVALDGTVTTSGEFNYDEQLYRTLANNNSWTALQDNTVSFTNVAVVGIDGDNATINSAARLNRDNNGVASGYAVDYIQLSTGEVKKGAASFNVANVPAGNAAKYNNYVSADKDTEIYVVYNGGVQYFKGYTNMPALNADTVGRIHAAYAVARNTTTGTGVKNYWMADVIVYEVEKWNDLSKSNIALAYYTAFQQMQSANGVTINTLNSKTDPAKVDLVPSGLSWSTGNNWWDSWGYNASTGFGWKGYGFYELYNTTDAVDGVMTARAIKAIDKNFNNSGIYAGTVTREIETAPAGYIPVNMTSATTVVNGETILATEALVSIAEGKVYSVTDDTRTNGTSYRIYTEANTLQYNNVRWSEVKANDKVIWVGGGTKGTVPNSASFIVDLGNTGNVNPLLDNKALNDATPTWLGGAHPNGAPAVVTNLWNAITTEQKQVPTSKEITISFKYETADANKVAFASVTLPSVQSQTVVKNTLANYLKTQAPFVIEGWDVTNMTAAYKTVEDGDPSLASVYTPGTGTLAFTAAQTIKDIEVTVTYAPIATSFAAVTVTDTASTGLANTGITVSVNGVVKGTANTALTGSDVKYGDTVTLTWTGVAHKTYTLSGADTTSTFTNGVIAAPATGNTYSISGKVLGAVPALTITTGSETSVTVTGNIGDGISAWATGTSNATAPATYYAGDKITAKPTVDAGYKITRMYWKTASGAANEMTETTTAGTWTSATPIGSDPVTIYVETESTKVTVTVAVDTATVGSSKPVETWSADGTGAAVAITSAGSLVIDKAGTINVTGKDGTPASVNVWLLPTDANDKLATGVTVNGNGTQNPYISNVTTAFKLTIYGSQVAYDTALAAATAP